MACARRRSSRAKRARPSWGRARPAHLRAKSLWLPVKPEGVEALTPLFRAVRTNQSQPGIMGVVFGRRPATRSCPAARAEPLRPHAVAQPTDNEVGTAASGSRR